MRASYTALELATASDGVLQIILSRPELLNRFDATLHEELTHAVNEAGADRSVRAIILASTGKVFSAGGDFELMRAAHDDGPTRRALVADARRLLDAFLQLPQPIVAAVQGAAVGLGATVALACDAVVAARGASLADTHVNVGLVAGDGGCLVWPAAAGMLWARRHLLDAETAFQLGMVTDLVDTAAEVRPAAHQIAERISRLPPLAVQGTKRALNRAVSAARGRGRGPIPRL
jgi:enoyl-CoA hydratase